MASSAAQLQTAFDVTTWDGPVPLYETDDYMYLRSDLTLGAGSNKPYILKAYKVYGWLIKTDGAGVVAGGNSTVADGSLASNRSTTDEDVTNDTRYERAFFYYCRDEQGRAVTIHEADSKTIVGARTRVDADNNTAWVDPTW